MRKEGATMASWESAHSSRGLLACTPTSCGLHVPSDARSRWSASLAQPPSSRGSPVLRQAAIAPNCSLCPQDANLSVYSDDPDLTPCFQNSVLAWVPCIYLGAALPCYLFQLRHHH